FLMISNGNLHVFILLILFIIFANDHKISANNIYRRNDYIPQSLIFDNDKPKILFESVDNETPSSVLWSIVYRPDYILPMPNIDLRRSINPSMSFKKRN
ncbi:unnamed protein product, partial [Rotaria sp. Silwood1]